MERQYDLESELQLAVNLGQLVENQHSLQVAFQEEAENNLHGQMAAPALNLMVCLHSSTHLAAYLC